MGLSQGLSNGIQGVYVALVTPMTSRGEIDEPALRDHVEFVLEGGVDGLLPVGTTGESPTLDHREHGRVIEIVIETARGRAPVMAGTGSNSTDEAIALTRHAKEAGADMSLQVTPYYNKPTQEGLYRHFKAVAEASEIPLILYNIPGRCGVEIELSTMQRLAEVPGIIGVKEATGHVNNVTPLAAQTSLSVLSGDDGLTLPMMVCGARGVVSVAANLVPDRMVKMVHAALAGNWAEAMEQHAQLYPIFKAMFLETNPIPVKAGLALLGRMQEIYRLPLCPMTDTHKRELQQILQIQGVL
jgi:4-hydroxy-tetrahydrodipicolinate synthase